MNPSRRSNKLPPNYRYLMIEVAGTGNGDEVWSLGLQKYETRNVRVGIWPFRRTRSITKWWTLETFGFGTPSMFEYRQANHSAWTRYHDETGGARA